MAGVYVHIPFCVKKCSYCGFNSYERKLSVAEEYIKKVVSEIKTYKGFEADTIYFGGGTPTVLESSQIIIILDAVTKNCNILNNAEITIEANPGTCDYNKLNNLKTAGFNRISFGLQSMNDNELVALGRIHTAKEGIEAVKTAQKVGFINISGDIMTAIPRQTIKSLRETVDIMTELGLKHISSYSLTVEEGTPFHQMTDKLCLPDEDTEREMYYAVKDMLESFGFKHYEISNFAREGFESRHNTGYWTGCDYIGIGAGAHSLYKNKRFSNVCNLNEYIYNNDTIAEVCDMNETERKKEYYMLGLRQMCGVRDDGNPKIDDLINKGLLVRENNMVRLTQRGIDVSNFVFSELM